MKELTKVNVYVSQWVKDTGEGEVKGIAVPCGECHACCTGFVNAQLYPHEIKLNFKTKFSKSENRYHLKHKPNGECTYLVPQGCSIHDRVPTVCRTFDCRFMGFFNIKDPKNNHIFVASKRWIFINDNDEIWQHLVRYFKASLSLMPVKSGDPVDYAAKAAILSAYKKFFVNKE
jgi:hypothetical protein